MSKYIDVTAPFSEKMPVWPGTQPVQITVTSSMDQGHVANSRRLSTPNHIGTHMDAPYHFINDGLTMSDLPLEAVCGRARVIFIDTDGPITVEHLEAANIGEEERLLIKTRNSELEWWTQPFLDNFAHFSTEAAQWLAKKGLRLIGIDYLSVSGYNKNEEAVHQALLSQNIWLVEGLKLAEVKPGYYELYCLPLKLEKGDGAPCRAILAHLEQ